MAHNNPHLWQEAASFAARAHEGQLRKDGSTPYVAHVYRVALTVRHVFGCEDMDVLCAALLHDTIEDTTTDYEDIREHFGRTIADLVAALTKNMALPEEERERDYDHRLAQADWRARLVKLADVYDNLCDSRGMTPDKTEKLPGRIARALALARPDRASHAEIDRAIAALEAIAGS